MKASTCASVVIAALYLGLSVTFASDPFKPKDLIDSVLDATTTQPVKRPDLKRGDALAEELLQKIMDSLAKYDKGTLTGQLTFEANDMGEKTTKTMAINSQKLSQGKFRHELAGDLLLVATGKDATAYLPRSNQYSTAGKTIKSMESLPKPMQMTLLNQNPRLALWTAKDAPKVLDAVATKITASVTKHNGVEVPVLVIDGKQTTSELILDARTHEIVKATIDYTKMLKSVRKGDTVSAKTTITYGKLEADVDEKLFGFEAPKTAQKLYK